jgi:hypothetical protein
VWTNVRTCVSCAVLAPCTRRGSPRRAAHRAVRSSLVHEGREGRDILCPPDVDYGEGVRVLFNSLWYMKDEKGKRDILCPPDVGYGEAGHSMPA